MKKFRGVARLIITASLLPLVAGCHKPVAKVDALPPVAQLDSAATPAVQATPEQSEDPQTTGSPSKNHYPSAERELAIMVKPVKITPDQLTRLNDALKTLADKTAELKTQNLDEAEFNNRLKLLGREYWHTRGTILTGAQRKRWDEVAKRLRDGGDFQPDQPKSRPAPSNVASAREL